LSALAARYRTDEQLRAIEQGQSLGDVFGQERQRWRRLRAHRASGVSHRLLVEALDQLSQREGRENVTPLTREASQQRRERVREHDRSSMRSASATARASIAMRYHLTSATACRPATRSPSGCCERGAGDPAAVVAGVV
jgi:hypothetical protein